MPASASSAAAPDPDVAEGDADGVVRSTFLFTDGLANVGIRSSTEICAAAGAVLGELGGRRCTVSTFGFGSDHSADLLSSLAEEGGGVYCYVENEDQIGEAFGEALGGLLSTTHQNVRLSLDLEPGILARAYTDYPMESQSGNISIELGDLFADERRDILVSFALPEAADEGSLQLGSLSARAFSVLAKRSMKTALAAIAVRRGATADAAGPSHPQVERHRNRHLATEALEAARQLARAGNLAAARQRLEDVSEALSCSPLTAAGDVDSTGLLVDVNDCLRDLRRQVDYERTGSKKMSEMKHCHGKQRSCGKDYSERYTNSYSLSLKAEGKTIRK